MQILYNLLHQPGYGGFKREDFDRAQGWLLGYSKTEIEAFIIWSRERGRQEKS